MCALTIRGGYKLRRFAGLDGLGKELRVAMAERRLDAFLAAEEIGVPASSISRICRHGKMPNAPSLLRILDWLGYRIEKADHP